MYSFTSCSHSLEKASIHVFSCSIFLEGVNEKRKKERKKDIYKYFSFIVGDCGEREKKKREKKKLTANFGEEMSYAYLRFKSKPFLSQLKYDAVLRKIGQLLGENSDAYKEENFNERAPLHLRKNLSRVKNSMPYITKHKKKVPQIFKANLQDKKEETGGICIIGNNKHGGGTQIFCLPKDVQDLDTLPNHFDNVMLMWDVRNNMPYHRLTKKICMLLCQEFPQNFAYSDDFMTTHRIPSDEVYTSAPKSRKSYEESMDAIFGKPEDKPAQCSCIIS